MDRAGSIPHGLDGKAVWQRRRPRWVLFPRAANGRNDRDNDERLAWPREFSFETGNVDDPFIVDNSGGRWCRLSWFVSVNRSAERHRTRALHGLLQREFRFTHAVLCEPAHAASLQRDL